MDPEQIYQEVLQEEQQKGVSGAVAEGRAKAARARAEAGSPHPKEAKWWPGAQPHLEGDGAAPAEAPAEEEAAEAAPEPEPEAAPEPAPAAAPAATPPDLGDQAAEADVGTPPPDPGIERPAAAATAAPAEAPAAAAAAGAPQPAAPAAAPAAAAQAAAPAAPATATELPPEARPAGVRHGVATGTRLRPEDEVSTEAQFEGQAAVYQRRKLIDELVATGVPTAAPEPVDRGGSPFLALLYILIPVLVIVFLYQQGGQGGEEAPAGAEEGGGGGGAMTVVAENIQFDTDTLELPADEETQIEFVNEDSVQHNIAIYETEKAQEDLFVGELITSSTTTYTVPGLPGGDYYFQCDVHPNMNGDAIVS